jgi:hypothetical protein
LEKDTEERKCRIAINVGNPMLITQSIPMRELGGSMNDADQGNPYSARILSVLTRNRASRASSTVMLEFARNRGNGRMNMRKIWIIMSGGEPVEVRTKEYDGIIAMPTRKQARQVANKLNAMDWDTDYTVKGIEVH